MTDDVANWYDRGRTVRQATRVPLGYQKITSLSTAAALTVPNGARMALISTETQSVRWRDDGTAPTSSDGKLLNPGVEFEYDGDLTAFKAIQTASSATLHVSYYE